MTGRGRAAVIRLTLQLLALLLIAPLASGDAIGGLLTRVQAFFDVTPRESSPVQPACATSGATVFAGFGAQQRTSPLLDAASSYKRVVIRRGEVPANSFLDACTDFLPLIGTRQHPFLRCTPARTRKALTPPPPPQSDWGRCFIL
jgi:hypothetical protein